MASPTLGRHYHGNVPLLTLQDAEWTPGSVHIQRREENLQPPPPGSNPVLQPVAKRLAVELPIPTTDTHTKLVPNKFVFNFKNT